MPFTPSDPCARGSDGRSRSAGYVLRWPSRKVSSCLRAPASPGSHVSRRPAAQSSFGSSSSSVRSKDAGHLSESGPDRRRCVSDQVFVGAAAKATRWTRTLQSLLSTGLRLPGSGCRFSARMMSIVPGHGLCDLLRGELAVAAGVQHIARYVCLGFHFGLPAFLCVYDAVERGEGPELEVARPTTGLATLQETLGADEVKSSPPPKSFDFSARRFEAIYSASPKAGEEATGRGCPIPLTAP
jgi:hypothetical protein